MGLLTCPHCGSQIGTEQCAGCHRDQLYYRCNTCGGIAPNPDHPYAVACMFCGSTVFEVEKDHRVYTKWYICQECKKITPNTKYNPAEKIREYQPELCHCGEQLAVSMVLNYSKCPKCGDII